LGKPYSIHNQSFPTWDEALTKEPEITLIVQVNGKVRARLQTPADITECQATDAALANDRVKEFTAGKTVKSVVYVPGKLVNVVVI
jgi:leucyl-tRNA synthetase